MRDTKFYQRHLSNLKLMSYVRGLIINQAYFRPKSPKSYDKANMRERETVMETGYIFFKLIKVVLRSQIIVLTYL